MIPNCLWRLPFRSGIASIRLTSTANLKEHTSARSMRPLVQFYRNRWPDPVPQDKTIAEIVPPKRTVPDECLKFELRFSAHHGSTVFFPHLKTNPADRKVILEVALKDLSLTEYQEAIFIKLVGFRFNVGARKVKLVSDQFQNRIENKRFLIVLLENLLLETRRLSELSI